MRRRALRLLLVSVFLATALALPPAFAQPPSEAELNAMNSRTVELYRAGKYGEAIAQAERYAAAVAARYTDNAPEYATALNNLAQLLQATNRLEEAEAPMRRALADLDGAQLPCSAVAGHNGYLVSVII